MEKFVIAKCDHQHSERVRSPIRFALPDAVVRSERVSSARRGADSDTNANTNSDGYSDTNGYSDAKAASYAAAAALRRRLIVRAAGPCRCFRRARRSRPTSNARLCSKTKILDLLVTWRVQGRAGVQ
jgi:hypothetical protein